MCCPFHVVAGNGFDGFVGFAFFVVVLDHLGIAYDDAARVEVVVECLALAKELGREQQAEFVGGVPTVLLELLCVLDVQAAAVAYGDGTLDDHSGLWVYLENKVDDVLDVVGVEEVLLWVVVGGGGNDNEVGIAVCLSAVEGCAQVQLFLGQVFLDILILNGRYAVVDFLDFLGDDVNGYNFVVLCQQSGDTQSYISCSCDCYFHCSCLFLLFMLQCVFFLH